MRYTLRHAIAAMAAMSLLLICGRAGFADDVNLSRAVTVQYESGETELAQLDNGAKIFADKDFVFDNEPDEILGLTFTRRIYNHHSDATIDAPSGATVYLILGNGSRAARPRDAATAPGWTKMGETSGTWIYKQPLTEPKHVTIPGGGLDGIIVATKNLAVISEKQPDTAHPASTVHMDPALDNFPTTGPSTRPAISQTSVKSVGIGENPSGLTVSEASEVTLTTTPSYFKKLTAVRFATPVGDQMCLARDDALRFIRLTYPNWNVDRAEITFDDKYVAHEGGSIGAAIGVMILSCIDGFAIDPEVVITGGVTVKGNVRAVVGVSMKIKDATSSKCSLVAVPMENLDQLIDDVIYSGSELVTDIQVIGITSLDDAVAAVRVDRDPKMTEAIVLFAEVQKSLKDQQSDLKSREIQDKLRKVLELMPQHLSAQILLSIAQGKQPKTLSASASQYYTFLSVGSMVDVLTQRSESSAASSVPSSAVPTSLANLRKLRPLADSNVRPLIDAWSGFIGAWNKMQEGIGSPQSVEERRQSLLDEMAKENANADLMQKMLKEGM